MNFPYMLGHYQSVQLLSHVRLFLTPWTAARQASLSITNAWSLLKLMSIELVMPSNHLMLCIYILPSVYIYTVEYYSAMKKNEIMLFATTQMQLEIIVVK